MSETFIFDGQLDCYKILRVCIMKSYILNPSLSCCLESTAIKTAYSTTKSFSRLMTQDQPVSSSCLSARLSLLVKKSHRVVKEVSCSLL